MLTKSCKAWSMSTSDRLVTNTFSLLGLSGLWIDNSRSCGSILEREPNSPRASSTTKVVLLRTASREKRFPSTFWSSCNVANCSSRFLYAFFSKSSTSSDSLPNWHNYWTGPRLMAIAVVLGLSLSLPSQKIVDTFVLFCPWPRSNRVCYCGVAK